METQKFSCKINKNFRNSEDCIEYFLKLFKLKLMRAEQLQFVTLILTEKAYSSPEKIIQIAAKFFDVQDCRRQGKK